VEKGNKRERTVDVMQPDQLQVLVPLEDAVDVPYPTQAGQERAGDIADGGQIAAPDEERQDGGADEASHLLRWRAETEADDPFRQSLLH